MYLSFSLSLSIYIYIYTYVWFLYRILMPWVPYRSASLIRNNNTITHSMRIYIYIYTYVYMCMYMRVYMYMYVYVCIYIYTYIHTYNKLGGEGHPAAAILFGKWGLWPPPPIEKRGCFLRLLSFSLSLLCIRVSIITT